MKRGTCLLAQSAAELLGSDPEDAEEEDAEPPQQDDEEAVGILHVTFLVVHVSYGGADPEDELADASCH